MKPFIASYKIQGFTLIEVLIAVLVTATGLLGLAKMQALAVSSTKESGSRSLIALQTGSLASMMHANPGYWASGTAPAVFSSVKTTITDPSGVLNATLTNGCDKNNMCAPAQLAAYDVQAWVNDMNNQFPTYTAKVNCTTDVAAAISCSIYVTWSEKTVAMNNTTNSGSTNQTSTQSFSVYVKP
jgi:type IV pilus assembly protein PilV